MIFRVIEINVIQPVAKMLVIMLKPKWFDINKYSAILSCPRLVVKIWRNPEASIYTLVIRRIVVQTRIGYEPFRKTEYELADIGSQVIEIDQHLVCSEIWYVHSVDMQSNSYYWEVIYLSVEGDFTTREFLQFIMKFL